MPARWGAWADSWSGVLCHGETWSGIGDKTQWNRNICSLVFLLSSRRGILFFAMLYFDTIQFALVYFDFYFLPHFTLATKLFALLIYFPFF
jgi:hypothetical protein